MSDVRTVTIVFNDGTSIDFDNIPFDQFLDFCLFMFHFYGEGVVNNYYIHV